MSALTLLRYALAAACLLLSACPSAEESRASARDWCTRKCVEAGARLAPLYRPTPQEIRQGHDACMRECMHNQGY